MYRVVTKQGVPIDEATSALIKVLRRSDEELSLYWCLELSETFPQHCWKRLAIFAAEDVGLADPQAIVVVNALWGSWERIRKIQGARRPVEPDLLVFALLYLVRAPKSREADAAKNWMLDKREAGFKPDVPEDALNSHTSRGKASGKTDRDWWLRFPLDLAGRYADYVREKQRE